MPAKLDLPDGAQPGSILEVTYPGPEESIDSGTYEGRLLGVKGERITVRFIYEGSDQPETVVINLETGKDETYHATVSDIQLRTATGSD